MFYYYCCVPSCNNTSDPCPTSGKCYHEKFMRFPADRERYKLWSTLICIAGNSTTRYICSEHFAEDAWRVQDIIMSVPLAKRRLKSDARPTLKLNNTTTITATAATTNVAITTAEEQADDCVRQRKQLVAEALAAYEKRLEEKCDALSSTIDQEQKKKKHNTRQRSMQNATGRTNDMSDVASAPSTFEKPITELDSSTKSAIRKKKCGEIIVDIDERTQTFVLNCSMCSAVFMDLNLFIQHICKQHSIIFDAKASNEGNLNRLSSTALHNDDDLSKSNIHIDFDNVPLITNVIYLLKQYPILWNTTHPCHMIIRERKNAITNILNNLKQIFPPTLKLTYSNVSRLVLRLRTAYRTTVRQKRKHGTEHESNYWFFDHLSFMHNNDDQIDYNDIQHFNNTERLEHFKETALQAHFDLNDADKEAELMDIIELYEQEPALWNLHHANYEGKLQNQSSLQQLHVRVMEKSTTIALDDLTKLLRALNNWFSAEEQHAHLGQTLHNNATAALQHECRFPQLRYNLEFLRGHITPLRCDICSNVFQSESAYVKHTRTKRSRCARHFSDVVHICPHCNKRFAQAAILQRHIRMHTNERPYECLECGRRFRNYPTLFRHRRTHTKFKPFQCNECNRCYYTQSLLRLHQKSHSGIADKVCDICGKAFTLSKYLTRHRDTHGLQLKYHCAYCDRSFATYPAMHTHRKRCAAASYANENVVSDVDNISKFAEMPEISLHSQQIPQLPLLNIEQQGQQQLVQVQPNRVKTIVKIESIQNLVL